MSWDKTSSIRKCLFAFSARGFPEACAKRYAKLDDHVITGRGGLVRGGFERLKRQGLRRLLGEVGRIDVLFFDDELGHRPLDGFQGGGTAVRFAFHTILGQRPAVGHKIRVTCWRINCSFRVTSFDLCLTPAFMPPPYPCLPFQLCDGLGRLWGGEARHMR